MKGLPRLSNKDLRKDQQEYILCNLTLTTLESKLLRYTDTLKEARLVHRVWNQLQLRDRVVYWSGQASQRQRLLLALYLSWNWGLLSLLPKVYSVEGFTNQSHTHGPSLKSSFWHFVRSHVNNSSLRICRSFKIEFENSIWKSYGGLECLKSMQQKL